jgi:hypothetical protein
LAAAATEGRIIVKDLLRGPNPPYSDAAAVIDGLMDALEKSADLGKPLWRRMVENYFTSVQPTPISDRVAKARQHLEAAGRLLAARMASEDTVGDLTRNAAR